MDAKADFLHRLFQVERPDILKEVSGASKEYWDARAHDMLAGAQMGWTCPACQQTNEYWRGQCAQCGLQLPPPGAAAGLWV